MNKKNTIKLFQDQSVRTLWQDDVEKWFFSIIDVIAVLADNSRLRKYWSDLKRKLNTEGSQLFENIGQLKMLEFYMGKNTPDRQKFIINNLKVELDLIEEN